ncbi:basic proline-rich protein-like [Accipiter gentilis]|uniref:basic proline-rich protein-like n=1 Tax=Astur gentilis TaxID=8957 RepID=UPI002110337B|nr:basic proline-rich protein-like [Accipiter gentilis]
MKNKSYLCQTQKQATGNTTLALTYGNTVHELLLCFGDALLTGRRSRSNIPQQPGQASRFTGKDELPQPAAFPPPVRTPVTSGARTSLPIRKASLKNASKPKKKKKPRRLATDFGIRPLRSRLTEPLRPQRRPAPADASTRDGGRRAPRGSSPGVPPEGTEPARPALTSAGGDPAPSPAAAPETAPALPLTQVPPPPPIGEGAAHLT